MWSWLQKWSKSPNKFHVGLGLLGEQGVESIHAHFNALGRTYKSIPEEVVRLRQLVNDHLLHVAPEHVALAPEPKKTHMKQRMIMMQRLPFAIVNVVYM